MRAPRFAERSAPLPRRTAAVLAACLASPALAQPLVQPDDPGAKHSTPSAERREPWPLRPDPSPGREGAGCPADAHYLFRIGGLALRLGPGIGWSADPAGRRPPSWKSDLPRCGDGRAIGGRGRFIAFEGRLAWRLKDWLDRRFMRRFA